MNPTPPTLLRIRDVDDLLAMVPYLLGYQPMDSVITLLTNNRRLVLTVRLDLPDPDQAHDLAEAMVEKTTIEPVTTTFLVGYGPAERVTPIINAARAAYPQQGVTVAEALRVTDGRWWSYLCTNPDCCPPHGTSIGEPTPAVVAAAIVAGRVARPDRSAVAALVAPIDGPARHAVTTATRAAINDLTAAVEHARSQPPSDAGKDAEDGAQVGRALLDAGRLAVDQVFTLGAAGQRLDDELLARVSVLLSLHPIRDLAVSQVQTQSWQVDLWADITRRVDPVFVAAPACLLAYAAWRTGHSALARAALDRVLAAEPDYTLAQLLALLLDSGTSPHRFSTWLSARSDNTAPAGPQAPPTDPASTDG